MKNKKTPRSLLHCMRGTFFVSPSVSNWDNFVNDDVLSDEAGGVSGGYIVKCA
jgi:hypothetical protein